MITPLHDFDREIWSFAVVGDQVVVGFSDRIEVYRISDDNKLTLMWEHMLSSGLRVLRADASGTLWGWDPMGPLLELRWQDGAGFEELRHESLGGHELVGQPSHFMITEQGPVIQAGNWIARRHLTNHEWEVAPLSLPEGMVEAVTIHQSGENLSGWLVSWDPVMRTHLLTELSWEAGAGLQSRLLPWVDMTELGRIKTIRYMDGEEPRLLIGGMKGILWADPALADAVPEPAKPVLFHNGKRVWKGNRVTAGYGEDILGFRYSSPGGSLHYPIRYQTRLSGRDAEWSEPSGIAFRELGQIWEGRYAFEVRAVDPFGRVSPVAQVDLRIYPPWFRSPLAWILYVLAFAILVWVIYRVQGHRLRKRQVWLEEEVRTRTFELEQANRFKDDFIANLSHEIRNPLNGVIGSIRQLKPEVALPARTLKSLRGAAHYLQTTVEEVLDFAKLESGEITVETSSFDLLELVRGVVEIHRPAARSKGLSLTTRLQIPETQAVVSDARKLEQIIGNLVGNAVKFTNAGSVTLGVRIQPEGAEDAALRIWVEDSGPGIPEPEQERVFEKFYQVKDRPMKTSGTGLGLSLVKSFVQSLDGELTLNSEPGKGSTFIVNLRVGLQPMQSEAGIPGIERKYEGVRILIVEDLEYNRTVLEDCLSELGCVTESADNGIDGLSLARSQPFSVILLDWELPGMSGLEVARNLRSDEVLPADTLIVGMTAYATAEDRQACLEAGMDVFLSKPISHHQLMEILDQVTGHEVLLNGPGLLMEMAHGRNIQHTYGRWLEFHSTYRSELEEAINEENPGAVQKAAHRLLGHLRMLEVERVPGITADLMTAAQAGDMGGVKQEWDQLAPLLDQLDGEIKERLSAEE